MKTGIIYVDIESLMDLRQGHLSTLEIEPEILSQYLLSDEYNFRSSDNFKFSTREEYKGNLNKSNLAILEGSTITYILTSILRKIDNIESRNKFFSETIDPEVMLNLYPIDVTDSQAEHIRNLLFTKLNKKTRVTVAYLPPKDISPTFFKSANVISAFIYDISIWLNCHGKSLETTKLHDTLVYTPALYPIEPDEESKKKIHKLGFKDLISYTSYLVSPAMSLNFLPVVFYSAIFTAMKHVADFEKEANKTSLKTGGIRDGNSSSEV